MFIIHTIKIQIPGENNNTYDRNFNKSKKSKDIFPWHINHKIEGGKSVKLNRFEIITISIKWKKKKEHLKLLTIKSYLVR